MSDFNAVVERLTTDASFRADLLKDVNATLTANNYSCTSEEISELAQLDESTFEQLDEASLDAVVGGGGGVPGIAQGASASMQKGLAAFAVANQMQNLQKAVQAQQPKLDNASNFANQLKSKLK
jgi:hypothetical protein